MKKYVIKRMLSSLFILFFLSAFVYFLIRIMPGDYVKNTIVGNPRITSDLKQALLSSYGLNEGMINGYFKWFYNALRGDLGISFLYQIPVWQVIIKTVGVTLFMSLTAFILTVVLSFILGMTSAVKPHGTWDKVVSILSVASISMPAFLIAAILQRTFALRWSIFPLSGLVSVRGNFSGLWLYLDMLWHLALPIFVLILTGVGAYTKFIRTTALQVLQSDFVLTARAKGLNERQVLSRHVFPNTLVPFLALVSGDIPALLTGTLIAEQIFSINGLGYTIFAALKMSDTPLIMGITMFLAVITVFSILLSDLLYGIIDPRIRLGKGEVK